MEGKKIKRENKFYKVAVGIPALLLSSAVFAESDKIMGGINKGNQWVSKAGLATSTVAIIIAGLIMTFNKERGFDKISGAIIGCIVIAAAGAIVALIQTFFSM